MDNLDKNDILTEEEREKRLAKLIYDNKVFDFEDVFGKKQETEKPKVKKLTMPTIKK